MRWCATMPLSIQVTINTYICGLSQWFCMEKKFLMWMYLWQEVPKMIVCDKYGNRTSTKHLIRKPSAYKCVFWHQKIISLNGNGKFYIRKDAYISFMIITYLVVKLLFIINYLIAKMLSKRLLFARLCVM